MTAGDHELTAEDEAALQEWVEFDAAFFGPGRAALARMGEVARRRAPGRLAAVAVEQLAELGVTEEDASRVLRAALSGRPDSAERLLRKAINSVTPDREWTESQTETGRRLLVVIAEALLPERARVLVELHQLDLLAAAARRAHHTCSRARARAPADSCGPPGATVAASPHQTRGPTCRAPSAILLGGCGRRAWLRGSPRAA